MKKPFVFLFCLAASILVSPNLFSQAGITSYSIYALGVNTNTQRMISGEMKMFANREIENLLLEADVFYNYKAGNYHRFAIGLGLNFGPFREFDHVHALTIPALIEIYPLKEFRRLSVLFELAPEILMENDLHVRTLWGIRYTFEK